MRKWKEQIAAGILALILLAIIALMGDGTAGTETAVPEEPPRIVISISQGKMRIIRLDEIERETELIETEIDQE